MKNRVGEIYTNKSGDRVTIIEYFKNDNCTIQYDDGTIVKNVEFTHIKKGSVKNPFKPCVFGVGFYGETRPTKQTKFEKSIKNKWSSLLMRCYYEKSLQHRPTYRGVIVCEEWHNFQNFKKWYLENYVDNWHIDKDILFKGNKIYSPETCCFVPQEINSLLTKTNSKRGNCVIGVFKKGNKFVASLNNNIYLGQFETELEAFQAYKTAKEEYIKEIANKYKDAISKKVYQTMINYQVEITD